MTTARSLLWLPLILLAAAACTGGGKDAPGPVAGGTTPTAVAQTTTTTAPALTTSTSKTGAPGEVVIPDTTGENFQPIVLGLNDLLNTASKHPERTDLLDLAFEPSGSARASTQRQLANLVAKGWRYADDGAVASSIELQQRPSPDVALVGLVTEQGPQVVVDGSGAVVQRGDGWKPRKEQYTLKRGADGRWRIATMTVNGPA